MRSNNSYLCFSVAALATAIASPVLAGGEAGKIELRDFGGKFVGFTTQDAANKSVDVMNPMFVHYLLTARQSHKRHYRSSNAARWREQIQMGHHTLPHGWLRSGCRYESEGL